MAEPGAHYEPPRIAGKAVLWTGAGLFALLAASLATIGLSFRMATGHFPLSVSPRQPAKPVVAPALQVHPAEDLEALRRSEDRRLGPDAALAIDKAMAAIAHRGRAAFDPLVPPRDPNPGSP